MSEAVLMDITGPPEDLYTVYHNKPHKALPDPKGIPFHVQGQPITFDQPHIDANDVVQATQDTTVNPLPFNHFVGVGLNGGPVEQINQPDFLGVNEVIFE
jgi:hypothetical protein